MPLFVFANNAQDIFELSLAELATIEIATKQTQNIYSSPSSISSISRQQLQHLGVTNLQSLLNFVPGFQSSRDIEQGTANRIAVRGRSTALSESVLVLIDGNKINDLYTGGISIINRMLYLGNVKRVEIIRGPGSALYGGNAFLGVINIITGINISALTFSATSTGLLTSEMLYHSENNALNLSVAVFDDQGDDYQFTDLYGRDDKTQDPIKGHDIYLKYQLDGWQFLARHMQRQLNDFLPLGTIGNGINKEKTAQWSLTTKYNYQFNDKTAVDVNGHYSKDTWDTLAVLIPKAVEIAPEFSLADDFIGGPYLTSHSFKVNGQLTHQFSEQQLFTLGLEYEQAKIDDVYTTTTHDLTTLEPYSARVKLTGDNSFNVVKTRNVKSAYIQDQVLINQQWDMTVGIRYDDYNDFGSTINPRLAFVWKPNNSSSLKFLYGSAFRAPNFLELYDKNNYVDFGNTDLSAEEVKTYEVVWVNTATNWHWEVTWFTNQFDQRIELGNPVEDAENPFYAPQFINRDNLSSSGFESELRLKVADNFSIQTNYTWFTKSSDISTSRQAGTILMNYQFNDVNVNLNHYYRGSSKLVENQKSYWLSGVNITYDFAKSLQFAFNVTNLFDKHFHTPSIVYPNGVPNRGRVFGLTMQYHY